VGERETPGGGRGRAPRNRQEHRRSEFALLPVIIRDFRISSKIDARLLTLDCLNNGDMCNPFTHLSKIDARLFKQWRHVHGDISIHTSPSRHVHRDSSIETCPLLTLEIGGDCRLHYRLDVDWTICLMLQEDSHRGALQRFDLVWQTVEQGCGSEGIKGTGGIGNRHRPTKKERHRKTTSCEVASHLFLPRPPLHFLLVSYLGVRGRRRQRRRGERCTSPYPCANV